MQRKKAFLIGAIVALMSFNNANAQMKEADKIEVKTASGNYKIGIGGLLVPIMEVVHSPNNVKGDRWNLNFDLLRARLRLFGSAFDPAITYLFQLQFEKDYPLGNEIPKASGHLLDASISWAVNPTWFHVAIGKFAVPGSRQQVISGAQTQFLRSSMVQSAFDPTGIYGRDVGVLVHNAYDHQLEYAAAVVSNGVGARLGYNHGKLDGYDAVDFAGGGLRFGVGASGFFKSDYKKNINVSVASADYMVKYMHFASNGAFYYKNQDNTNVYGASADAGYLINGKWEPMIRYGWLGAGDVNAHEIMAGVSHYWYGHNVKTQLYGGATMTGSKVNNGLVGVGLQLAL